MRENRKSGSEGGEAQTNELSLPLSVSHLSVVSEEVYPPPVGCDHLAGHETSLV